MWSSRILGRENDKCKGSILEPTCKLRKQRASVATIEWGSELWEMGKGGADGPFSGSGHLVWEGWEAIGGLWAEMILFNVFE